jgi:hypothetical protein
MKTRKIMVAMVAAITALSFSATVFAADQLKTKDQIKIKNGTCVNR